MGRIYSVYFMQESTASDNLLSTPTDYNSTPQPYLPQHISESKQPFTGILYWRGIVW